MASLTGQGRFNLTRDRARKRAAELDAKTHKEVGERLYGPPHRVLSQIRAYLLRRCGEMETSNNPIKLLKFRQDGHGMALIVLGPTFDKGPTPEHFHFDSGARLSFALTLRERGHSSELVAFRFHYQLPEESSPEYIRFDLNETLHEDALAEPRCHLHPGLEDVRIPLSLHDPIEILDQIFFAIDGSL
jgi:hypothetical protein